MWKLILPYSIVQPILLRFRHETVKRVDVDGKGLINRYVLDLPIPSPDESITFCYGKRKEEGSAFALENCLMGP